MTIERKVGMGIAGQPSGGATDVADVFSTYLYTGTSATPQSINNGIDLAGEGGMVWFKDRTSATQPPRIYDTERGYTHGLRTDNTNTQGTGGAEHFTSFDSNGFTVGSGTKLNWLDKTFASWTFRKKLK